MQGHITYSEVATIFGNTSATQLLQCVERVAEIKNEIILFDKNVRWEVALRALSETNLAI